MFDEGTGPPVVLVPGIHGRWEWSKPALNHLARRCRAISFSLCGDIGSGRRFEPALGFENYVRQLDNVLNDAGVQRVAICGVSFGGYIALRYAARRPERVSALVLASVPGPQFRPSAQQSRWLSRPWASTPTFVLSSPVRLWPEVAAAFPRTSERLRFFVRQGMRCVAAPIVPPMMATRMRCAAPIDFQKDSCDVRAATLVVSGEESLDRVVPVGSTRAYTSLIRGAQYVVLRRTGHIGVLTQPAQFAEIVTDFVHAHHR